MKEEMNMMKEMKEKMEMMKEMKEKMDMMKNMKGKIIILKDTCFIILKHSKYICLNVCYPTFGANTFQTRRNIKQTKCRCRP